MRIAIFTKCQLRNSIYFRVDSIMLLDSGFNITSSDGSDKMLKYALKTRWDRRKETAYDNWGEPI